MAVNKNISFGVEYDQLIEQGVITQDQVSDLVKLVAQEELLLVARTIIYRRVQTQKAQRVCWEADKEKLVSLGLRGH